MRTMPRSDLRAFPLLLAAVLLAGSAIGGGQAAEQAPITGRATAKVGKPIAPRNLLGRRTSVAVPAERIQPNAIGVVPGRPGRESETRGTMPAVRFPAVGGTSGAGFAKPGGRLEGSHQPQLHTTPIVPSAVLSRPAISGTGASRRGYAPAAIGGPAKTAVGISGTAFRAKH
jgi:hypothetical protein